MATMSRHAEAASLGSDDSSLQELRTYLRLAFDDGIRSHALEAVRRSFSNNAADSPPIPPHFLSERPVLALAPPPPVISATDSNDHVEEKLREWFAAIKDGLEPQTSPSTGVLICTTQRYFDAVVAVLANDRLEKPEQLREIAVNLATEVRKVWTVVCNTHVVGAEPYCILQKPSCSRHIAMSLTITASRFVFAHVYTD